MLTSNMMREFRYLSYTQKFGVIILIKLRIVNSTVKLTNNHKHINMNSVNRFDICLFFERNKSYLITIQHK